MDSEKFNVVITGASSGIGRALAKIYSTVATSMVLLGRDEKRLRDVAEICREQSCTVSYHCLDLERHESVRQCMISHDENYPIDLLIANAGISNFIQPGNPVENYPIIERVMNTNYFGTLATVNPVLNRMRKRNCGQIVIVCSLSAYRGMPFMPAYSASKSALKTYYESIRGLVQADGVYLSIACPSFVNTPMTEKYRISRFLTMSAEQAAHKIKTGVNRRKAVISFPMSHVFGLFLLDMLPNKLVDMILLLCSRKDN